MEISNARHPDDDPLLPTPQTELTQRRLLQQAPATERNMLRAMIDSIPDLVFVKDTQSRFVIANQAVVRAFGLQTEDEIIGKTDFDFFPADMVSHIYASEQALFESGQALVDYEEQNNSLGGIPRWFSTTKIPLRDEQGKIVGFVAACREITQHKQEEAELVRRNAELSELYARLSQTQEQLIQSEKLAALGSLVAGIAHELNTPISNSMLAAGTLAEKTSDFTDNYANGLKRSTLDTYIEDNKQANDIILRNLQRACDLVTSFKHVAIDQSSSRRRTFSLAHIVAEVLMMLSPSIKHTPFTIATRIPDQLELDSYPGPLQQVLINLINNALLHGFEGRDAGAVSIIGRTGEDGWLELAVSDDGVGIPAANLSRIFEPFFSTKFGTGGSGLGLSIAYNIVTGMLGSRISVESKAEAGSSFVLRIPCVAPRKDGGSEQDDCASSE